MTVSLRYAARSDVGLVRSSNQDSAYAGPHLLVVADGMGGHAGGDIASKIAIDALRPLDTGNHTPDAALADLEAAVEEARLGLVRASAAEPQLQGMGTTVTALLRTGSALVMAHMGDSRAYLLRDGALTQVTVDHTFVQHLVDTGRISPDEAEHHPQRNVVMRVLSDFDLDLHPDMSIREARPGDRWLLCSDGLSGFVPFDLLGQILVEAKDPGEAADLLLLAAMRGNSTDNITVVVADVVAADAADGDVGATPAAAVAGAAAPGRDAAGDVQDPGLTDGGPPGVGGIQVVGAASVGGPVPGSEALASDGVAGGDPGTGADQDVESRNPEAATLADSDLDSYLSADLDEDDLDDENFNGETFNDEDLDDDALPAPRRHPVIITLVTLLVLALVGLGGWQAYEWTQRQYYVGISDGHVAVFRGVPASAGPIALSRPVELTDTLADDLPAFFVARLDGTIRASSLDDARTRAQRLIDQALPDPEPSPAPTPPPTPSPEPTPEPPANVSPAPEDDTDATATDPDQPDATQAGTTQTGTTQTGAAQETAG